MERSVKHARQTAPARADTTSQEEYTKAMLNILDDFACEKTRSEETQRAIMNILDDAEGEKGRMAETQRAVLNILDDFAGEKARAEDAQRAMLNILDDFDTERTKANIATREIREAFDSLRRAKEAAEAANREIEAFSYSVSHDLRAPLRHVQGFVELLRKHSGPALDEKGRKYMDTISHSASRMGVLIDDLLAFSRMGRSEMHHSVVNLEDLAKKVIGDMLDDVKGREITWDIGALPRVHGDPTMLRLVLVNLISNALKFTRPQERAVIEIGSYKDDHGETVFFVRDNGVGFEMQYVDKLFGVFQRLHRQEDFEGTGIGLANVKRIISRHGGKVWAEGALDRGATFYFTLPGA